MSLAIPIKAPALNLPSHRDPYYAGAWQKPAGRYVEVTSPGTGESLGKVVEGMDVVDKINSEYGEQPDQDMITKKGAAYLKANFPNLDSITTAVIQ